MKSTRPILADRPQRFGPKNRPRDVLKRTRGFWKKMGRRVKNRSTESQQRAVVEGISRFPAAEGAVRLPRERKDTRGSVATAY
eukprot:787128-Pleurochrysis_carterae.AAC.1